MNVLIEKLNKVLKDYNLCCVVKKETMTLLHCYLYEIDDCKESTIKLFNGKEAYNFKDYTNCNKYDVTYKKQELYTLIQNNALDFLCKRERKNFDIAKKCNMLRR